MGLCPLCSGRRCWSMLSTLLLAEHVILAKVPNYNSKGGSGLGLEISSWNAGIPENECKPEDWVYIIWYSKNSDLRSLYRAIWKPTTGLLTVVVLKTAVPFMLSTEVAYVADIGDCHSPVNFCAHSRAYRCSLLFTHAHAATRISRGKW